MRFLNNISLTSRILISFWATLILVVVSMPLIFLADRYHEDHQPELPPIEINDRLVVLLLSKPFEEVRDWYQQQDKRHTRRIFVVYQEQEILGRRLPKPLKRIAETLSGSKPFIHNRRNDRVFVGRSVILPNGERVKILLKAHLKEPHFKSMFKDNIGFILLVAIFISGIISYLLARNISTPILALRDATVRLASGDLSARVQPNIKKRFKEVSLLADDFDTMAEKLDRTISSHKHLIQDISHELRSPVARLQLALELAKKRLEISDDQPDILRIEKECEQINQIISTLLNLPAYELDPHLGLEDSIDVGDLIHAIKDDLNYSNPEKNIKVINHVKSAPLFLSNQQLLRSAFENVFKNAQQYHEGPSPIVIELSHKEDTLEVTCCDNGPGTDEEKLNEIFKPFYRADQSRARESGGFGLGLAISKRAIDLHQGSIRAYNRASGGMCIVITLPLKGKADT
jgi:two-component system sensor histidine kinase CpxA